MKRKPWFNPKGRPRIRRINGPLGGGLYLTRSVPVRVYRHKQYGYWIARCAWWSSESGGFGPTSRAALENYREALRRTWTRWDECVRANNIHPDAKRKIWQPITDRLRFGPEYRPRPICTKENPWDGPADEAYHPRWHYKEIILHDGWKEEGRRHCKICGQYLGSSW